MIFIIDFSKKSGTISYIKRKSLKNAQKAGCVRSELYISRSDEKSRRKVYLYADKLKEYVFLPQTQILTQETSGNFMMYEFRCNDVA